MAKEARRVPDPKLRATAMNYMNGLKDEHAHRVLREYERAIQLYGPTGQAECEFRNVPVIQKAIGRHMRLRIAMSHMRKAYLD